MDILQWIDTGFRAVAGGFFALIPGLTVWTVILVFYLLIQWMVRSRSQKSLGTEDQDR